VRPAPFTQRKQMETILERIEDSIVGIAETINLVEQHLELANNIKHIEVAVRIEEAIYKYSPGDGSMNNVGKLVELQLRLQDLMGEPLN